MEVEFGRWRIRPYGTTCWQIDELKTVEHKDGASESKHVPTGTYPTSIGHALAIIAERELKDGNRCVGLEKLADEFRRLHRELMEIGKGAAS